MCAEECVLPQHIFTNSVSSIYIVMHLMCFLVCLFFLAKNQMEFCCHMLRGSVDPKKTSVYEYVKFIGNFKSLANSEFLFFLLI